MKKLLILVDRAGTKKKYLASYVAQRLIGVEVVLAEFSDLLFKVSAGKIEIKILGRAERISDFDFVHLRRSGQKYLSVARAVAVCLEAGGKKYSDRTFAQTGPSGNDKLIDSLRLSLAKMPIAPFCYCAHTWTNGHKIKIAEFLGYPLVAKNIYSQRGEGIFLVPDLSGFENLKKESEETSFLFQKYIPAKKEYRLLVLDGTIGSFEQKINLNPDEFRANVALGATEKFFPKETVPSQMKKLSLAACRVLNLQVGGVDILVDAKKKNWLLEVNRGPGLTYDPKVSPELDSFVDYFRRNLNAD